MSKIGERLIALFKRCKKKTLREKVRDAYGDDFVENIYDKMGAGIPVGGFLETIVYLEMIEEVKEHE